MADHPAPTVRGYAGPSDHPRMVRVRNAVFSGDGQGGVTVADFDAKYANLQADLVRDCFLVELGQVALGYARYELVSMTLEYVLGPTARRPENERLPEPNVRVC